MPLTLLSFHPPQDPLQRPNFVAILDHLSDLQVSQPA